MKVRFANVPGYIHSIGYENNNVEFKLDDERVLLFERDLRDPRDPRDPRGPSSCRRLRVALSR